jgi:hypothetical protein
MNGSKAGVIAALIGLGAGSALMYWLDPAEGKRRRAQVRHTTRRAVRQAQKCIDVTSRNIDKIAHMELKDAARTFLPPTARALIWR